MPLFTQAKYNLEPKKKSKDISFYEIPVKTIDRTELFGYTNSKGGDSMVIRPHYLDLLKTYRQQLA